jgi:hypothetical protein
MRPLVLRFGIGIGFISGHLRPPVNQLTCQAFEFARAAIAKTKQGRAHSDKTISFQSTDTEFDAIADLVYRLHDALVGSPSEKQWETIDASVHHAFRSEREDRELTSRRLGGFAFRVLARYQSVR